MEGDFNEPSSQKQSLFNSTISQLMRIDSLWKDAHRHSRSGMFKEWNSDLDRVFCELSEDATEDNFKEFWNFYDMIIKSFNDKNEMYVILLKKEIYLRKMQNKQGKGTAYRESMEDYMSD